MKNKAQIHFILLLTGLLTTHLLSGQNVGIGTTTPDQKVDVEGNIITTMGGNITAGGTLSAATINFNGTETGAIFTNAVIGTSGTAADIYTSGDFANIYTSGANSHIYTTGGGNITSSGTLSAATINFNGGTETGNISTDGNIVASASISTTGFLSHFFTTGGSASIYTEGINSNIYTTGANSNIYTTGGGDITSSGTLSATTINFSGLETGNIITTGNITATNLIATNSCTCPSDARFKQNIVPLPKALDKVLALRGVG